MELDKEAVYRIDTDGPDLKVTRVIDDLERPNGLAVSPDQKTLYVVDNNNGAGGSRKVYAYELRDNGSTGKRRVIHDFGASRGGECGFVIGRDHNPAITIDRAGQARIYARGERQRSMKRERVSRTQLEPRRGGN
jgi:sugar lactone lactonase YvrE